ncbi:hypothetical protein M2451_002666 [Dysgonomonas sp. PFB1-18]|uniref:hypothetical protein n=1 Tax=unclassified Dysgonomonas TaxID=2630389 RepID=UPI0024764537|nr:MULTISPECIES: hypothetical protein [unclassified Dysgonomonas]MDH6309448.1 hypothetical protein [Dysgonomonas sp. PF1-14]MDH6381335.1 hypothetical protein [Dysgonomonas sp. PFB1-18]
MATFPNSLYETPDEWLREFFDKVDLVRIYKKTVETLHYRELNPDWERPVVMYGIRKTHHKCIKKQEIAVIIDLMPWQDRARMAETHWYKIIYKRPATDLEWDEMKLKKPTRRYWIWSYFIEKGWSIDKIVSHIVQDDGDEYHVDTTQLIKAFENYYGRRIRIYRREIALQLDLF